MLTAEYLLVLALRAVGVGALLVLLPVVAIVLNLLRHTIHSRIILARCKDLPLVPPKSLLFGSHTLAELSCPPHQFFDRLAKETKDAPVKLQHLTLPSIVIARAEHVRRLFATNHVFKTRPDLHSMPKGRSYDLLRGIWGESLATMEGGHAWKMRRAAVNPAFKVKSLRHLQHYIRFAAERLTRQLLAREGERVDMHQEFTKLTFSVISAAGFGFEIFDAPNEAERLRREKFVNCFKSLLDMITDPLNLLPYGSTLSRWRNRSNLNFMNAIFDEIIVERLQKYKTEAKAKQSSGIETQTDGDQRLDDDNDGDGEESEEKLDLLDLIIRGLQGNSTIDKLDIQELRDYLLAFFLGGYETTSSALGFAIDELMKNPDCDAKLYEEIMRVMPATTKNGPIQSPTYAQLKQMPYAESVFTETLRLHAAISWLTRECPEDVDFGDFVAPAGAIVTVNVRELHRDPAYFKDPLRFRPERWDSNSPDSASRDPFHFIAFSVTDRICIGKGLAIQEAVTALATLLREIRFEPAPGEVCSEAGTALVRPDKVPVIIRRRNA